MQAFLLIVHVACCIGLVVVILLQSGKGGGLGSGFGGAGAAATQIFGGRGAGNFLSRTTVGLAAVFMATSLTLAYLSSQPRSLMDLEADGGGASSVEDEVIEEGSGPAANAPTPDAPAQLLNVGGDAPAGDEEAVEESGGEEAVEGGEAAPADADGEAAPAEEAVEEAPKEEAPAAAPAPKPSEDAAKAPAAPVEKKEAAAGRGAGSGAAAGAGVEAAPGGGDKGAKPEEEVIPGANGDGASEAAE